MADRDGGRVVAEAPSSILQVIGGRSSMVRLSAETADKQARKHPDVRSGDYALVQRILDEGELFRDRYSPRAVVGFLEEGGRLWRAAIKATEDGSETWLTTLHKARQRDLRAARRDQRQVEREKE